MCNAGFIVIQPIIHAATYHPPTEPHSPTHQLFLSSLRAIMSSVTLTSTSRPNFTSIFNVALDSYRRKTKKDLASHPLLPRLQSCGSTEAILDVFREQIPALNKSQNIDGGFTEWVIPTVNVLHSFSDILGQAVGLVNIREYSCGDFLL